MGGSARSGEEVEDNIFAVGGGADLQQALDDAGWLGGVEDCSGVEEVSNLFACFVVVASEFVGPPGGGNGALLDFAQVSLQLGRAVFVLTPVDTVLLDKLPHVIRGISPTTPGRRSVFYSSEGVGDGVIVRCRIRTN